MGKHKGIKPIDKPAHKRYNNEDKRKKNKERKQVVHEKRLARFAERRAQLFVRLAYKKACRLVYRCEELAETVGHLTNEIINKAKQRKEQYERTGTIAFKNMGVK